MKVAISLVGAAAALVVGSAPASALVIDAFFAPQSVEDSVVDATVDASQVVAPTAIGGFRSLHVQKTAGDLGSTSAEVGGGVLSFDNGSRVRGDGWITWDGAYFNADNPEDVDTDGLGGVDLLAAGPLFDFEVLQLDHNLQFTMRVWDIAGGFSDYFEALPPVEQLDTQLRFSQFDGNADFSSVGALQIFVSAPEDALDVSIGDIEVIPLPASALLLLGGIGGLGGLGALRARRRSA